MFWKSCAVDSTRESGSGCVSRKNTRAACIRDTTVQGTPLPLPYSQSSFDSV